jgi:hypothetical protein
METLDAVARVDCRADYIPHATLHLNNLLASMPCVVTHLLRSVTCTAHEPAIYQPGGFFAPYAHLIACCVQKSDRAELLQWTLIEHGLEDRRGKLPAICPAIHLVFFLSSFTLT